MPPAPHVRQSLFDAIIARSALAAGRSRPAPRSAYPQRCPRQYSAPCTSHTSSPRSAARSPSLHCTPHHPSTRLARHATHLTRRTQSQRQQPDSRPRRHFTTTPTHPAVSTPRPPSSNLLTKDRGPRSTEDTQTDFGAMNVLGSTANPSTSVDVCSFDGFALDSGLRVEGGDGIVLTGGQAFVWRPWGGFVGEGGGEGEGERGRERAVSGDELKMRSAESTAVKGRKGSAYTGGVINKVGQFEVPDAGWGLFDLLWPRPDILIIGTGPTILPLAPATRKYLTGLGMRLEILDTRNAAAQFNLLATERGTQEIAAAMVPIGFGRR